MLIKGLFILPDYPIKPPESILSQNQFLFTDAEVRQAKQMRHLGELFSNTTCLGDKDRDLNP
jgi:hypothetical protein